jgi:hypothetical protein
VLAVRGRNSSGGFLAYELVIPGRITIYPVEGEGWQNADEKLQKLKNEKYAGPGPITTFKSIQ